MEVLSPIESVSLTLIRKKEWGVVIVPTNRVVV